MLDRRHEIRDFLGLVPDSVAQLGAYLAAFAEKFVWGYMACVIGAALLVEHAFGRAAVRWQGFAAALAEAIEGRPVDRRPALAAATPAILPVSHAPVASNGVATPSAERVEAPSVAPDPSRARRPLANDSCARNRPRFVGCRGHRRPGGGQSPRPRGRRGEPGAFCPRPSGRQWFARQYYESVMGQLDPVQEGQR